MSAAVADRIDEARRKGGVVVLDGGLATELERRGVDLRDPLWSARALLDDPTSLKNIHRDYLHAGTQCISTASYQATLPGLMARGLSRAQAEDALVRSVKLAQQARDEYLAASPRSEPVFIAASIGPYGAYLADGSEFRGDYGNTREQLVEFHFPRMEILAAAGADLLACETVPCLLEAEAFARCLERVPQVPAWVSFSCQSDSRICHGEPITQAATVLAGVANVVAVGVNCTDPIHVAGLVARLRESTSKPIVVYPNSGETWDPVGRRWVGTASVADYVHAAVQWRDAGATLIGGCCRTGPEHIRAIAALRAKGRQRED